MRNIAIACDHAGIDLKNNIINYLKENFSYYNVLDLGTNTKESCDYPIFASYVCNSILKKQSDLGILICGTGVGMSIVANKFKNIRAVCCSDPFSAKLSKEHNNTNVLCIGSRVLGKGLATFIVESWLQASFEEGRHQKRVDMIDKL